MACCFLLLQFLSCTSTSFKKIIVTQSSISFKNDNCYTTLPNKFLSIYLSVCLSVCLSVRPSVRPSIRPASQPASQPAIHLSITWIWMQVTFRLSTVRVIAILMKVLCSADYTAVQDKTTWASKIVSMIRKYHNHKLQINPWHREEEQNDNHKTPGRQAKQTALSSPSRLITWQFRRCQTSPL